MQNKEPSLLSTNMHFYIFLIQCAMLGLQPSLPPLLHSSSIITPKNEADKMFSLSLCVNECV